MDGLLRLRERVEIAVEIGESHYREFKSAYHGKPGEKVPIDFKDICYTAAKELVAFANADGGELFIGIEDNGEVTGMRRMFKEMSNNEMAEPRISSPNKSFIVELFYKSYTPTGRN